MGIGIIACVPPGVPNMVCMPLTMLAGLPAAIT
eukprot:CAMPEP_0183578498 /NCGR_PEP_ID=MMETSP0371-20130417/141920_1 /TAXON_ID=268820 /ORGANISM="Peridinium aciculiferum, Strain PAER-2" /LENGTH=32 /DNA_ID= /DNA_START= /DNA_END= /DNA_ORIENTATION=